MKTNSFFRLSTTLVLGIALTLSGCRKDKDTDVDDEETTVAIEQTGDETMNADELEGMTDDVEQLITTGPLAGGRIGRNMCGVTLDSNINNHTYTITFDGTINCNGRTRSGSATVTLYNRLRWRDSGAVLGIEFRKVVVHRVGSNRSMQLSGLTKVYNVNGGLISQLYANPAQPVVRRIRTTALKSKNEGASEKTWNVAKTRTYAVVSGEILRLTITGDTMINGVSNVSSWGQTRRNMDYTTRITTPIVRNSTCGYDVASGQKVQLFNNKQVSVLFGVDAAGNAVTTGCPYGALVTYTNRNGTSQTRVVSYR